MYFMLCELREIKWKTVEIKGVGEGDDGLSLYTILCRHTYSLS